MCAPLLEAASRGEDSGTEAFLAEWAKMVDKLIELAREDEDAGHKLSAGEKLKRAANYGLVAERMQSREHPERALPYAKVLDSFLRGTALAHDNVRRVVIPYEGRELSALWTCATTGAKAPAVVFCNGLDSIKELLWFTRLPQALARRGISTLCVDQPGTGEALRLHDLVATHESERWASRWVDWLGQQPEVDADRLGMTGISLGGYYAPRAVAFEPRFASGAVWGANHDWAEVQQKRIRREGENPVPHYWAHVRWVFGAQTMDDFIEKSKGMTMEGEMQRIRVPFLVTHGAHDRQISVDYAHRAYAQLTNSPRRELKIFTSREGGVEHVGADNMSFGRDYVADWFAETLGGHTT